jgi:signal transduction histidine kinase
MWQSAYRTQAAMVDLSQRLGQLARTEPAGAFNGDIDALRDVSAEVGDDAIQAAVETTVLSIVILVTLAVGLWYTRRRLAQPFADVLGALEQAAAGRYGGRLDEDQPEEFGAVARSVNRMTAALASRQRMQEEAAHLLTALNARANEAGGGTFGPTLDVLAAATGAVALALYQPDYDSNEWAPTAVRRATAQPLGRDVVRRLLGDSAEVHDYAGRAAEPVCAELQLSAASGDVGNAAGLALVPLRSRDRLVGLLVVLLSATLSADARASLEQAAPNLALACERESAHQHTRRLAIEVRHAAQRLESQNAALTSLNEQFERQHEELTRVNAALDQASKLKDQFLANVSHELRTPLNSVIGFSDLLLTVGAPESPLTEIQRDYLDTIARNGRHLLALINDLLDLSKIAAGRMELRLEPVVVELLLREAADTMRAQLEARKQRLVLEPLVGPLLVNADRGRARQILLNLLSNAIKFTGEGGEITLSAQVETGGHSVRVAVRDTGIGIAAEDQRKLFQEFVQVDAGASRRYEGTGLGLALSKRLVELHGGSIGVVSEPGQGSTFWFTVPRAASGPEPP